MVILYSDTLDRNTCVTESLSVTKIDAVIPLLKQLDGDTHTQLILANHDNTKSLTIAGRQDCYLLFFTLGVDEAFYYAKKHNNNGNNEVRFNIGGQTCYFFKDHCCFFDDAIDAADYFIKYEDMNPELDWQKE